MAEQLTDQALVERVQQGDKKAFNLLVSRYQNKVAGLLTRYISHNDIPDVVQESFIKAYRSIESFRGDSAFYTWLYRIAVNTAKNAKFTAIWRLNSLSFAFGFWQNRKLELDSEL